MALNNTLDQMDLHRTFHSKATEYKFFPQVHIEHSTGNIIGYATKQVLLLKFIYLFILIGRGSTSEEQRERGRRKEKESQGSTLSTQSTMRDSNSPIMSHDLGQSQTLNQLSHPDSPQNKSYKF